MQRRIKDGIEWLEFDLLAGDPRIVHGVFLRKGGVSRNCHGSLNVIAGRGDDAVNVAENRRRIRNALQLDGLISGLQVHGSDVKHLINQEDDVGNCDSILTGIKKWGLIAMHADCQATLLYDPVNMAIGTVHAGWRGQTHNIYSRALQRMSAIFGSKPKDILACISPSLGPENSEFINYRTELPEEFWPFQIRPTYFDLWAIARYQLEACGILPRHIEIAQIDTYSNPEDFYSYRRERKKSSENYVTGCHGTVIAIK